MVKKKIVVKLSLADEDSRRDAMKLAVQVPGVSSTNVDKDKGQMTVVGEDVDPVAVTKALRSGNGKLGKLLHCVWPHGGIDSVQLVSVEEVKPEEKKDDAKKKEEEKKKEDEKKKDGDAKPADPAPIPFPWVAGYPYNYYYGGPVSGAGPAGPAGPPPPGYQWVEVSQPRGWFDW